MFAGGTHGSPANAGGTDIAAANVALAANVPSSGTGTAPPTTSNGRAIYARFREGLADPSCDGDTSERWQKHFANAPKRLASSDSDALPLFGYVVDELRKANLPTEYALIPFVESGYKPGAQSPSGPAGLWQFIALTARSHGVAVGPGYDGRLSPVDSTQAAVRYLKTLHGMFGGDWRLAVMAYNAGEYRVMGALKRSGQKVATADPASLPGLSNITYAYVRKLHALSCVLDHADDRNEWLSSMDRPVRTLTPKPLPADIRNLDTWSTSRGLDPERIRRLNPAFVNGRVASSGKPRQVLAPPPRIALAGTQTSAPITTPSSAPGQLAPLQAVEKVQTTTTLADAGGFVSHDTTAQPSNPAIARTHTIATGDSIWRLAKHYGVSSRDLLTRNDLHADAVLKPGMVLKIDPDQP